MGIANRTGETGVVIPSRKLRTFKKEDGYWYYRTREGMNVGPFDSQQEAEASVKDFIENFIRKTESAVLEKIKTSYS